MDFKKTAVIFFIMSYSFSFSVFGYNSYKLQVMDILEEGSVLHTASVRNNKANIRNSLLEIQKIITQIRLELNKSPLYSRIHFENDLNNLDRTLEKFFLESNNTEEKAAYKKIFGTLAHLARNYKVSEYKIFYCHKNKATWIQKSYKVSNPIGGSYFRSCGARVQ